MARIALLRRVQINKSIKPKPIYTALLADNYTKLISLASFKIARGLLDTIADYDHNEQVRYQAILAQMLIKSEMAFKTLHSLGQTPKINDREYHVHFRTKRKQHRNLIFNPLHADNYVNSFSRAYKMLEKSERGIHELFMICMRTLYNNGYSTARLIETIGPRYPKAFNAAGFVKYLNLLKNGRAASLP